MTFTAWPLLGSGTGRCRRHPSTVMCHSLRRSVTTCRSTGNWTDRKVMLIAHTCWLQLAHAQTCACRLPCMKLENQDSEKIFLTRRPGKH